MRYIKADDKYGRGESVYAGNRGTGNCTDYHSYLITLARSVGIPGRFAIGAAIPSSRDEGAYQIITAGLNFTRPVIEIDGKPVKVTTKFSFKRIQ